MSDLFYLQDSRNHVGNDMLFHAIDGKGYTTDMRKAHKFTGDEALQAYHLRSTDIPWLVGYIDTKTRPAVDFQYVSRIEMAQFIAEYCPETTTARLAFEVVERMLALERQLAEAQRDAALWIGFCAAFQTEKSMDALDELMCQMFSSEKAQLCKAEFDALLDGFIARGIK